MAPLIHLGEMREKTCTDNLLIGNSFHLCRGSRKLPGSYENIATARGETTQRSVNQTATCLPGADNKASKRRHLDTHWPSGLNNHLGHNSSQSSERLLAGHPSPLAGRLLGSIEATGKVTVNRMAAVNRHLAPAKRPVFKLIAHFPSKQPTQTKRSIGELIFRWMEANRSLVSLSAKRTHTYKTLLQSTFGASGRFR